MPTVLLVGDGDLARQLLKALTLHEAGASAEVLGSRV